MSDLDTALREAVQGLLYPSETTAPLEPFAWPEAGELTADKVRTLGEHDPNAEVRAEPIETLITAMTEDQDWHGPEEKAVVQRYRRLFQVMQERLTDLKVFSVGKIEVTLYIVGRTPAGNWAGVMTWAVET